MLYTEIDKRQFDQMVRLYPQRAKMEMGDALDHIQRHFLKVFFQQRLQGPPGIKAYPHGIKTHFFRASIYSPTVHGMGLEIWSDSEIAKLHETGGVVRAKNGARLAVPLSARTELFTKSGRIKKQYRDPRRIKNLFPKKINSRTFLVKRPRRKDGELKPLFVLKASVRIKARLGFFKVWDGLENWRIERINKGIDRAFQ